MKDVVYLLHFDRPLHHARHYMGSAADLDKRLGQHANGGGARLTGVIRELGIGWTLARVWRFPTLKEARTWESHFKRRIKCSPHYCPICRGRA